MKNKELRPIRIYLDNCCFNRPFDDQRLIRNRLETEAKLYIQEKILNCNYELVWSYILEYENFNNPFEIRRKAISIWKNIACINMLETQEILLSAKEIIKRYGLKSKDALHIACAIEAKSFYFLTTDDIIIRKLKDLKTIQVVNPINLIYTGEDYENK